MPFRIGAPELIILLVIIMIIFGVGKLPQVGNAIGKALREFRKGQSGAEDELEDRARRESGEAQAHKNGPG